MKKLFVFALVAAILVIVQPIAAAVFPNTITITPYSAGVFDANHVVGVLLDSAPGFANGSFRSDGVAKTDMYFTPEAAFKRSVTVGEIASVSYWTKKGTTHAVNPVDWAGVIYTKPYPGDVSTPAWYGDRIGFEPYYAMSMNDPAGTWVNWNSNPGDNQLVFYESTAGAPGANFGSYNDPDLATLKTRNALSGSPYAGHQVLYFSIQTGSATAAGFTGQVDGLRVELASGEVWSVNMEAVNQPQSREACMKAGFLALFRADGSGFRNVGDCVSYVSAGK